jgi:WD40 repeat protein
MAGLVGTMRLAGLTRLAAEAGAAEGDPRPVFTWAGPSRYDTLCVVRSYLPSGGGAPRLVAVVGNNDVLGVWDTGTGAFLQALQGPGGTEGVRSLLTYQRPSDGRPRVAALFSGGQLYIWDGDDFQILHIVPTTAEGSFTTFRLAVYEEPTSGSTRLVTR